MVAVTADKQKAKQTDLINNAKDMPSIVSDKLMKVNLIHCEI